MNYLIVGAIIQGQQLKVQDDAHHNFVLTIAQNRFTFHTKDVLLLQNQYKDIQASAVRTNTTVIPVHDDDDGNIVYTLM